MKTFLLFLSIIFLLAACAGNDKPPKDVLPKQQMQAVLWDLVQATEYLNGYGFNADTAVDKTALAVSWYEQVYRIHHTTKAEFDRSYAWYRDHPLLMREMLDSMSHTKSPLTLKHMHGDSSSIRHKDSTNRSDSFVKKKRILPPGKGGLLPIVDTAGRRRRLQLK